VVVVTGEGIVMLLVGPLPDPMSVPPQLVVCQFKVAPEPPVAESVIFPLSFEQILFLSLAADNGATGKTPETCVAAKDVSL
jgi:hypothetical protein